MVGGAGNDIYRFANGFGRDNIGNLDPAPGRFDSIEFIDLDRAAISIRREGNNLVLYGQDGDSISVSNHFLNTDNQINEIRFADGKSLSPQDIARLVQEGTDGRDSLIATAENPVLHGKAGNDTLTGHQGNDELHGDTGDDTLRGLAGDDLLLGGEGRDTLNGEAGNDILAGGAGHDALNGGTDDDLYIYTAGHDTLYDQSGNDAVLLAKLSREQFGQSLARQGNDLQVRIDKDNVLTLKDLFVQTDNIEHFVFADGTSTTVAQIYKHFGATYQGSIAAYDAGRALDEFNKISGII